MVLPLEVRVQQLQGKNTELSRFREQLADYGSRRSNYGPGTKMYNEASQQIAVAVRQSPVKVFAGLTRGAKMAAEDYAPRMPSAEGQRLRDLAALLGSQVTAFKKAAEESKFDPVVLDRVVYSAGEAEVRLAVVQETADDLVALLQAVSNGSIAFAGEDPEPRGNPENGFTGNVTFDGEGQGREVLCFGPGCKPPGDYATAQGQGDPAAGASTFSLPPRPSLEGEGCVGVNGKLVPC